MLVTTSLYAGLIALLFLGLSARVILYRRAKRVSLGDGNDPALLQLMRAQANCAEYAPIGLILLALAEAQGAPPLALHSLGMILLAGRLLHAYGISRDPQIMALRVGGMALSLTMIALAGLGLVVHALLGP
jgi:uncharacterized membrane protein YecN with MAPEG domain